MSLLGGDEIFRGEMEVNMGEREMGLVIMLIRSMHMEENGFEI